MPGRRHVGPDQLLAREGVGDHDHNGGKRITRPDAILRFQHEAACIQPQSSNICTIYEIADQDGTPFISLWYLLEDAGRSASSPASRCLSIK